jgi:hypothetical protein
MLHAWPSFPFAKDSYIWIPVVFRGGIPANIIILLREGDPGYSITRSRIFPHGYMPWPEQKCFQYTKLQVPNS